MIRQANILLVDDDTHVREALGEVLASEDFRVTCAANSSEALRRVQEAGEPAIDVVLLDLILGEENGWQLFHSLSHLKPFLPVVLIGSGRGQQIAPAARVNTALMDKPLDIPLLIETLRGFAGARDPRPAGFVSDDRRGSDANQFLKYSELGGAHDSRVPS